ncbi:MAG TPA: FAD-binding oxidoreductase [Acidimicrobiales bacterium]|nr:FAD-binding oxidoreductase [Acidimicrobiales bacterium]
MTEPTPPTAPMPPTEPTPPTPIDGEPAGVADRLGGPRVAVPGDLADRLAATGAAVRTGDADRAEAGRDWWPLAIGWAARGMVPARPAAVVRPSTTEQVAAVLAACSAAGVPVTAGAGRSGVCGGAVPVFGGVALDCTGLAGDVVVDERSLVAEVPAGMFGPDLEGTLRGYGDGYTLGHWPQSMDLSTVGGWLACRGAGQYSTRYGKIEDMVVGLEVVLADGRVVRTEGHGPRAATGPSLTQLFVGSEGTLGVITRAWFRVHPMPPAEGRRAFGFGGPTGFADGLDACRRVLRRGATPAVLRLYDQVESGRNFDRGDTCVLIVLDEADPGLLAATLDVVDQECAPTAGRAGADRLADDLVDRWLSHRNDVSALAPLWRADVVVDTVEVAGRWSVLAGLADDVVAALQAVPGTLAASVHQSHAYPDGACLYFTFGGRRPDPPSGAGAGGAGHGDVSAETSGRTPGAPAGDMAREGGDMAWEEGYYREAWDTVTATVRRHGAAISHHHGIGLNRSRYLADALGTGFEVLAAVKGALDPAGILNPGKLGLPSPFGEVPWP